MGLAALGRRSGGAWVAAGIAQLQALRPSVPPARRRASQRLDAESFGRRFDARIRRLPALSVFIVAALAVGPFAVVMGVVGLNQQYGFLHHGVAVTGEVVAIAPSGRSSWDVTVRYPVDGQDRTAQLEHGTSTRPTLGASVSVVYDATRPGWVTYAGDAGTASGFSTDTGVLTLGVGMLIYGPSAWARQRRWRRARAAADLTTPADRGPRGQQLKGRPTRPRPRRR